MLEEGHGRRWGNGLGVWRVMGGPQECRWCQQCLHKLGSESGNHKPAGMGPPLRLRFPTGTGGTRAQAGPLVPTPSQPTAQLLQWVPSDPVTMATSLQLEQRSRQILL